MWEQRFRPAVDKDNPILRGRGRRLAALWLSSLVLASVGGAPAAAAQQPVVGTNVPLTVPEGIEAHNSPTTAVDPTDPANVVIAARIDRPAFSAAIRFSLDGGKSWAEGRFPVPPGEDRPFAPDLVFDRDGILYLEFVTLEGPGNSPGGVWLARSSDGGATFSDPVRILDAYAFQVRLTIDVERDPDRLWITWLQAGADAVQCQNCFAETGLPILAAYSDDGGDTWSDALRVSDPQRARVGAPVPAIGAEGELIVLYYDFRDDRIDWENLEGTYSGAWELVLARSSEDGDSFSEAVVDDDIAAPDRFLPYIPPWPSLAVDDDLVLAGWHDDRNGDWDVFVARSEDGGEAWEEPVRVNDDEIRNGRSQYLPQLDVAAGGRVDITFYDRRGDPNNVMTDVYLASSTDRGQSFAPNLRVSDLAFSSRVGPEHIGAGADFGSRIGLASVEDRALAVWTDTRNGTVASAKQDIYAAVVTDLPSDDANLAVPVIALTAGLIAGTGGSLLLGARMRRRAG
ncbi:hypothetical protein BH24ACT26_BH24ACT26_02440 [soil metagenome]